MPSGGPQSTHTAADDDERSLDRELRRLRRAALFFVACLAVVAVLAAVGLYHWATRRTTMTWVRTTGRATANILDSHSLNPEALRAHVGLYRTIMFGESGLSRVEREAVAVAVSAANECHYWVVQHSAALAREGGEPALTEAVVSADHAALPDRLRALCAYAVKLTLTPRSMQEADVEALRSAGLSDRDIVDANQVVAYFNYVNRVADGLGVELEDEWPDDVRRPRR